MYKLGSLNDDAHTEVLWKSNCPSQAERHWGEKPALTSAPDGMGNKKSLPWEFSTQAWSLVVMRPEFYSVDQKTSS